MNIYVYVHVMEWKRPGLSAFFILHAKHPRELFTKVLENWM